MFLFIVNVFADVIDVQQTLIQLDQQIVCLVRTLPSARVSMALFATLTPLVVTLAVAHIYAANVLLVTKVTAKIV